jgi:hypothetical protein
VDTESSVNLVLELHFLIIDSRLFPTWAFSFVTDLSFSKDTRPYPISTFLIIITEFRSSVSLLTYPSEKTLSFSKKLDPCNLYPISTFLIITN